MTDRMVAMATNQMKLFNHNLLAFISGLLGVFAFAPFNLYPLAIVSLSGILIAWIQSSTQKSAFFRGLFFGAGYFGAGVYWVFISIHSFGNAPIWIATLLTALLILVLSLFIAIAGMLLARYFPVNNSAKLLFAFPAVWSLSEWVRGWAFTGFPWISIGTSQTHFLFTGVAALAGVLTISFILAHIAGLCVYFYMASKKGKIRASIYLAILLTALFFSQYLQWTKPINKPVSVSLVQGNIAQSLKWKKGQAEETFKTYTHLSKNHWDSDLVIWPEAAVPTPIPYADNFTNQLVKLANQHKSGLIFGIPYQSADGQAFYNGVMSAGNANGRYFKRHLVPFGEHFPVPLITRPLLKKLNIPMSDFRSGEFEQPLMTLGNNSIATFICYEIAFPDEVRNFVEDANFIIVLSDDAWFGHSTAQAQQLQEAQMRAMEMQKYVLSVTNNGLTAIINPRGKITHQAPPFKETVLSASIQPMTGKTFWMIHGADFVLLLSIISLFLGKYCEKRFPRLD